MPYRRGGERAVKARRRNINEQPEALTVEGIRHGKGNCGSIPRRGTMSYKQQKEEWLREHPNATIEQAYEAGYLQSTDNWVHQRR